ncbi:20802_t:CDS:2 [Cetraspora pellucida]|uniref:20802_t:CDS:1 n=1 Tax=Cetraspora pellucida TaxID=1433469 RepID=A0A9N8Z7T3_9GLOM|nr:20802_t:CDS:2 [Cetraspora pellucida]
MALKKLENVDLNNIILSELDKDIYNKDIDYILKSERIHSSIPSVYGGSTTVEKIIETWNDDDDSNNVQKISQDSQKHINKFLLQQWNLHKGLKVYSNTFIHGEEILTKNGTLISQEVKQHVQIYTNIPFDILKNISVSVQKLEEIDICLHIRILNIEYKNFEISEGFSRAIDNILKNQENSIQKVLQKFFEKYGDYVTKKVVIGGALRIKSASPKERKLLVKGIDILKANLYWANDQIFSGKSNIFGKISFDNIFTIEDTDNKQRITSGHDLMVWMEELYEYKRGYVIEFNEIVPTYTFLNDEIRQKMDKVCGGLQSSNIEHIIVPYITNSSIPDDLNRWAKDSPMIYLCHWINNLYFHYGLIIQQNNIIHGLEVAMNFLEIPEICLLDTSYIHLRQPLNKKEAFILANCIKMDNFNITEIPFLTESLTNNVHPIFNEQQSSNEIHCFIISEKIKLTFNTNKLEPSEKFLNAVKEALNSNYPFCNLKNVFNNFGYLCPCSIILGRTFSKICESDINDQFVNEHIDFSTDNDESKIIEETLEKWNKTAKNLDTSFFLDFNGDIVKNNEIYFRLKSMEEKQSWKTITQDLIPLYKILPKDKQNEIESINPLQDSDYEMFGCLIINGQNESDVMIRFSLINQYGCRATINKLDSKSIPVGAQVFWIVLAKGYGYFSMHTRNIKIAHGKKTLTGQLPINVEISVPTLLNPWLNSCFLVTCFDSENFNKNQVIKSKLKDFSETCLSVEVFQYNLDEIQNEIKNLTMRWCIIDTHKMDEKDHITVDVGSKTLSLSFLGVLASNVISGDYTGIKNEKENHTHNLMISSQNAKFGGPAAVAGQKISAVQTVGDAITPFVPLFDKVTNILTQMLSIYENAKCNEKICMALLDRVEIAQTANIRKFSKEVTQLDYFQKFINANAVKDAFKKNIKEFEEVCRDLNLTMAMYNAEQREMEAKNVAEDLEFLKKSMNEMKDEIKAEIRLAITEVTTLMSSANHLGSQLQVAVMDKTALLIDKYKVPRIDPIELSEPFSSNDNVRGSRKTVKKIFRGIEVACKKGQISKHGESGQLKSPDQTVERANYKIQQLELAALLKLGVTDRFEPKISHIELSHSMTSIDVLYPEKSLADIIRWLAPGKMRKSSKSQLQRYNHRCEMYSSGDIPSLELPKTFEEKVCITDSQPSDLFKAPDELDDKDALNEMKIQEIIKYMTMAADHENPTALFNLGDIYWKGKLGVPVDKAKGELYIKLAALKGQQKALLLSYLVRDILRNYQIITNYGKNPKCCGAVREI